MDYLQEELNKAFGEPTDTQETELIVIHEHRLDLLRYELGNALKQLKVLSEFVAWAEPKIKRQEVILNDVANEVEQRYKYLLQEQQGSEMALEAKMDKVQKAVGYCLRKVREAVDTEPQSVYLKQILDAVQDLESKVS